ncbi:bifunctional serine/threonine-protein kinase/formylglycine-generating enzyme family protein [Marinicella meishanensis]|uniref:bifunctional serine/threonine-protein kinase/formylglycine-generating enzyme family protein n=1 Tax=Marinicella meishanensis TaxID=2873263 RepID=UPI001CC0770B|nr:bifunctional serine/threonine-protein kinase/formylglycine-generating enzyme family protein [Marinicella sp. NBU2979]
MTKIDHKISIPDYRIIRKIGEGGMSVVYLAHQESLKREVALKVMRPIITDEENVVRRFTQEAEIIAKLYHPNIVNIYEVGHVDDEILFYSMPYLQHGDLTTFAYHDDEELKQMIAGICDGLSYAHTQGVVHRDIKPENILFDQFGNVQIADFGIALSTGRRRFTKDSRIIGSVYYMSPEQAQSKHVDARSDIYGLGAILYEVLTGEPVFEEDNDLSLMMAHVSNPVPDLPPELAHWQPVIKRCLAKSPNQRYQNMQELKAAVLQVSNVKQRFFTLSRMGILATLVLAGISLGLVWQITREQPTPAQPDPVAQTANGSPVVPQPTDLISQMPADPPPGILDSAVTDVADDVVKQAPAPVVNLLSEAQEEQLLQQAKRNIQRKQLTTPKDNNALDQILQLLTNIPQHAEGLGLLSDVMAGYYELLYQAVQKGDLQQAKTFADSVSEVRHRIIMVDERLLHQLELNTELERSLMLGSIVEKFNTAKGQLNHVKVNQLIALVDQVVPGQELVDELTDSVKTMLRPGQVLTDQRGIKTVVITPQYKNRQGLLNYGLAVTRSEVTFAEYDRFVRATNHPLKRCKSQIKSNMIFSQRNYTKPGFKVSDDMPVVCVSWPDANQYALWLSEQTGHTYRLPTAREWRHLMKLSQAGSGCGAANLAGQELQAKWQDKAIEAPLQSCDDGVMYVASTTRFGKDGLGLYGMGGNVSEWLSGCEALGKFKAIFNPDDPCDSNPVIGRSWMSGPDDDGAVKSVDFDEAWTHIGFRLIRDLRKE